MLSAAFQTRRAVSTHTGINSAHKKCPTADSSPSASLPETTQVSDSVNGTFQTSRDKRGAGNAHDG